MQRSSVWEALLARPLVALLAYVAAWTLAATLTFPSLHHDMLEAWVWGQHPSLGYFKHPPLSALLPAIWFGVMPRQDWAFYLLAYTNAAAGLGGALSASEVIEVAGAAAPKLARLLARVLAALAADTELWEGSVL